MILFFDIPSGLACLQLLLLPLIENGFSDLEVSIDDPLFDDLFRAHAQRLYETPETTRQRYKLIIQYVKNNVIPEIQNNCDIIGFSLDYQNIVETTIASLFLKIEIIFFQYPGLN